MDSAIQQQLRSGQSARQQAASAAIAKESKPNVRIKM